jgi:phage terminase large subunit-like protein
VRADGLRQYRTAYLERGRKNGKSEEAAAVALYCLVADGEEGAEVYGAACDRDQASIVFHVAADMVRRSPHLSKLLKVIDSQKRIVYPATGSFYRAIPADAAGAHGYNASAVIFDEVHAQPNRELWDVLTTSTAAREQPLIYAITTAGYDRSSICWELHEYALRVQAGTIDDPTFFVDIRALPEEADWTDERLWHLANPGLEGAGGGDFRGLEELRTAVAQAKERPAMENTIRRLYFSQWTSAETRWFGLSSWDACGGLIDETKLKGMECYGGLDLGSTSDFTALALVFPRDGETGEGFDVVMRCWLPEAAVEKRSRMKDALEAWIRAGFVTVTPGDVLDYRAVKDEIVRCAEQFDLRCCGYDPWMATQIAVELNEVLGDEFMVPVRQGFRTLSPPSKLLETLVGRGLDGLNHGGHPVLRWCADNVVAETNADGAVKPSKKKSSEKIDLIAALVTAIERGMVREEPAEVRFVAFD